MIKFTSCVTTPKGKTPLTLEWVEENFETMLIGPYRHFLISNKTCCHLLYTQNNDGKMCWILSIQEAIFFIEYKQELELLLKTFRISNKIRFNN